MFLNEAYCSFRFINSVILTFITQIKTMIEIYSYFNIYNYLTNSVWDNIFKK